MKSTKKILGRFVAASLLLFITLTYACQTSTEPDPEPPPIEPEPIERVGTKELTITITDRDTEDELTGYDIEIDGSVTASESGVSSAQFILADVVSGEYTITVSLDGYVQAEVTEELEVPTDQSSDFLAETTISLRELTPPVEIKNDEDTTVKTGKPDEEDAEEDEAVTLQIPANTFPAAVVKADGSVDISVTRAKPSQAEQADEGLVSEDIILTPTTELNNPVTITIPVREIAGLEGLEYFLQPGNIPLTQDGNGNLVATISTAGPVAEFNMLATINNFRRYRVTTPGLTLTSTDGFSNIRTLSGACGAPLNVDYPIPGVTVPPAVKKFGDYNNFSKDRTVNVSANAVVDRVVTIQARHATRTFTVSQNGNQLSTVTVNRAVVDTSDPTAIACHNSGGN